MTHVKRIVDGNGSYIEPPFDPEWSEHEQLRWQAAVVSYDTGLDVKVNQYPTNWNVVVASRVNGRLHSIAVGTFQSAWDLMSGISTGANIAGH